MVSFFYNLPVKKFADFEISKATMGYIIKFFHITSFFRLIESRIDRRLTFTKKFPWRRIVKIRNDNTHTQYESSKEEAVDFVHFLGVFLYETGLDHSVSYKETVCFDCRSSVDPKWNYCANCGSDLSTTCKKCSAKLKSVWIICPNCQTPRSGIKTKNPELMYNHYCEAVWADGIMTKEERIFLDKKREELGIEKEDAIRIEEYHAPKNAVRFRDMVEATLVDGIIDENERIYLRNKAKLLGLTKEMANEIFLACLLDDANEALFVEKQAKVVSLKKERYGSK
ncbi:MAG: hypothetical protein B7C24_17965 [Bacteroidetes bacterium 4572_77]|nr:MAG: hypothetical protein B7C24_17965 [Bacteroidetes bacterium 4572_77]